MHLLDIAFPNLVRYKKIINPISYKDALLTGSPVTYGAGNPPAVLDSPQMNTRFTQINLYLIRPENAIKSG